MKREKVAIVGSGISGISSSLFLSKKYEVYLFEKNNYLGGHTRTKTLEENNILHNIDTGFIVFNESNYPDLVKLFEYLNIDTLNSNMSFSISITDLEFEYGSSNLNSLFAQKKNLLSLRFWLLLKDIIKLYNHCKKISFLKNIEEYTLEDFLIKFNYSKKIKELHIYPMVSSIWSCNKNKVKKFPLISFINFFNNHRLFNFINRQQWKFVKGGSHKYIKAIISKNLFNYKINKCVKKILRDKDKITIIFNDNERFIVDKIILATHADQALNILNEPSQNEIQILSKFKYSKNYAYLHSDNAFMPRRKTAWSSWNFQGKNNDDQSFSLTYWMNLLQNLQSQKNFFLSINPSYIPNHCHDKTTFEHPIFSLETLSAQKKINKIQGNTNTWFCGSYCGYGFHEDGIQSAIYVANLLGVKIPWDRPLNFFDRLQFID
ncbi:NAD(P)-binding protein [Alphaproteobacteria bacterium]|nr:NAD(P)-binding protein [Alphaproteobacteria bacterium]